MDRLILENLEVPCVIGDTPEERERESVLLLDIELATSAARASVSDDLADAVDYAALAKRVAEALRAAECRLIERAAGIAAAECLEDRRVESVRVRVKKRASVPCLGAACVEVVRP